MTEPIRVIIDIVTPVHIGDGLEYDPVDYVIRNNSMVFYNPILLSDAILADGEAKYREFCTLCKTISFDNKISLDRFQEVITPYLDKAATHSIPFSKAALIKYKNDKKVTAISSLIKGKFEQLPYIPGSTVKGMLKTIMLWKHFSSKKLKNVTNLPFGMNDPWRLIEVSDFQPVKALSFVDLPINLHNSLQNGKRKISPIPAPLELIKTGSSFIGTVSFNDDLYNIAKRGNDDFANSVKMFFPEPMTHQMLREAVKEYGDNLFNKEHKKFGTGKTFTEQTELEKPFYDWWEKQKADTEKDSYRLIKLGKHAGAISKMIYGGDEYYNGIRNVKIPQQRPAKTNDTQTTVWLSSSGSPLGWAKVVIKPNEERLNKALEDRKNFLESLKEKQIQKPEQDKPAEQQTQKPQKEMDSWERFQANRIKRNR